MSCYPKLSWPNCNPGAGVYECSDPALKSGCCLSAPTTDKTKSNCPAGWESDPKNSSEWCTDSFGIFSKSKYRHKCKRTSCPNSLMDPSTNCTTCVNPLLAAPDCKTCANPLFAAPDCKTCANPLLAPPSCTACRDSKLQAPACTKCSNPLFQAPDCTKCANSLLDPNSGCTSCANPLFQAPDCKTCANPLLDPKSGCKTCLSNPRLAPPFCVKCANPDLADPDCTSCINPLFVPPTCNMCFNSLLDPNSGCTSCSNPLFAAPDCTTCANPLLEYPECTSCANPDQDIGTQCATCTNSLLEYPGCVDCAENKLLAPPKCTECLDANRVAPDCEKCRQGMFVNPDTNMCAMCGERDCAKAGCECAQGACVNDVCSCITTQAPLATDRKTYNGERNFINMFPSVNTAFVYAPKEMFETSAPVGGYPPRPPYYEIDYRYYIYGFWGFIQIYDHQITAMDVVDYNRTYPNPVVDKQVNRTAGKYNTPGYRNAMDVQSALFNAPKGLALDKTIVSGKYTRPTLFVADSSNHCIRMISITISPANGPNGNPQPYIVGVSTLTGSNWPGLVFDAQGLQTLYATSGFKDGNLSVALFNNPTGLDFDSNGVMYVADTGNNVIRKIVIDQASVNLQTNREYTGTVSTLKVPELVAPVGVLFNDGFLYVCDRSTIRKIDVLNTQASKIIALELNQPYGMVFKGKNLLFSDATGVKILVNAGQMPPVIRPVPSASFPAANRPQALMEYQGNIVVGLQRSLPVQISGKDCTCFTDVPGNC